MEDCPWISAYLSYVGGHKETTHWMPMGSPGNGLGTLRLKLAWSLVIQARTVGCTLFFLLFPWISCVGTSLVSNYEKAHVTYMVWVNCSMPASHTCCMWHAAGLECAVLLSSNQLQCCCWMGGLLGDVLLPSLLLGLKRIVLALQQTCLPDWLWWFLLRNTAIPSPPL